jgi:hypothetical protein
MQNPWLVVIDTTQIQPYIFGSNRLSDNVGASWLVKQATGPWALQLVSALKSNVKDAQQNQLDDALRIENGNLDAEVIYAGGGNVLILFAEESNARDFVRRLSRKALCEAPGLHLLFALRQVDWSRRPAQQFDWTAHPDGARFDRHKHSAGLFIAVMQAFQDLERQKSERPRSAPLLGLGVSMACRATGLPAAALDDDRLPISAEIEAKRRAAGCSNAELSSLFGGIFNSNLDFPLEMDRLGRARGEQSFVAVAHADGNGMGQAMIEEGKRNAHDNRDYIEAVRKRSQLTTWIAAEALRDTLRLLSGAIQPDEKNKDDRVIVRRLTREDGTAEVAARLVLHRNGNNRWWLPFRPLVYGGDDLTFVCDARIGLSLMLHYLRRFEARAKERGIQASACAGVAMVKSHYPFSRAYDLAEELCSSAKRFRAQRMAADPTDHGVAGSYLDWHFATGGLTAELDEIRRREYEVDAGRLYLRPVSVSSTPSGALDARNARCWSVVEQGLRAFQGAEWADRRNKVKALRDALRQGKDEVERFRRVYLTARREDSRLPELVSEDDGTHRKRGWLERDANHKETGERCAYFDALELADVYIGL